MLDSSITQSGIFGLFSFVYNCAKYGHPIPLITAIFYTQKTIRALNNMTSAQRHRVHFVPHSSEAGLFLD
jgi:hypothetical protein